MYYLIENIISNKPKANIYFVSRNVQNSKNIFKYRNKPNINFVNHLSKEYYELLATAEYLINDTTFYPFFNKREGQKYYIIWHGTPLKNMGKDMPVTVDVANVQRNFYMADKIYVNNDYTKDILIDTHNLKNVYSGKFVVGPSSRNSVFYDEELRVKIRNEFELNEKKVIAYMPTWRGSVGKVEKSRHIDGLLTYLDATLEKGNILYVKLHSFERKNIKNNYKNIKFFPDNYETYEFLTATDALVTDYSSVMYDYINLKKPVILYTYDFQEYKNSRGIYENIDEYPFTNVTDMEDLKDILNNLPKYNNDLMFNKKFIPFDRKDGSKIIVENMIKGYTDETIKEHTIHNGKETVVILSGGFWNNGITTALINTLENIDTTEKNYICFFGKNKIKKEHYYRLLNLPENVLFYPVPGELNGTVFDKVLLSKYLWNENYKSKRYEKSLRRIYREEFSRIFGDLKVDWFIHYTGFERKYAEMARHIDCNRAMWVHTDMFEEFRAKQNFSKKIVFDAYKKVEKVVLVHNNLRENLINNIDGIANKIITVNNFLGEQRVRKLSNENLFESLYDVKVDYSFNDNAYHTNEQKELDTLRSQINNIININGLNKYINYKKVLTDIFEINNQYLNSSSNYIISIIRKEMSMLKNSYEYIRELYVDMDENLIYKLLFEEYKNFIIPKIKMDMNEVDYYYPEYKEKLKKHKLLIEERLIGEIKENRRDLLEKSLENHIKALDKSLKDYYTSMLKDYNLREKYISLFSDNSEQVKDYVDNYLVIDENKLSNFPNVDFYYNFRISKIKLMDALYNPDMKVFINIGRYDYQKGHDKLIESFENAYRNNQKIFLILVCPHGPLKSQTINQIRNSFARDNIVVFGGINNPYPLLKHCDAFILSSNYEGLGLVVYEALALGTDVITVNIPETIQYLDNKQAIIVENSVDGLTGGINEYLESPHKFGTFNFDKWTNKSIEEFKDVFK